MAFGNILSGFSNRMVQDIVAEREARRKAEDSDIDYQMEIISNLTKNPNVNPNILNRAISDLAALNSAKTPGARKSKGSMYGGSEVPVSQLIQSIASGIMPMQGPTTEQVQRPVGEQIEMTRGAELQPFNPQSLPQIKPGGMDGMDTVVPPAPLGPPPMITPLQRAAKQAEMKTQLLPPEKQPLFRSPDEMAAQEGQAAGVRAGAIRSAQSQAEAEEALKFMSPEEWKQVQMSRVRGGAGLRPQLENAGYYTVNGKTIQAVRREMPDGSFQILDALSGLPIPPNSAEATFAPKPEAVERDERSASKKEYDDYVKDEVARGTPANKIKSFDQYMTADANRKAIRITNTTAGGFSPEDNRRLSATGQLQSRYEKSREDLTKIEYNVGMMNTALRQLEAAVTTTGGRVAPTHQAIIMGFNHAIEPQSVVREAEYDRSLKGQAWFDRVRGLAQKMSMGGAGMTIEEAREYGQLANDIMRGAQARYRDQLLRTYANQAAQGGIDLSGVFRLDDYNYWQSKQGAQPAAAVPGAPVQKKSLSGFIKGNGIQP